MAVTADNFLDNQAKRDAFLDKHDVHVHIPAGAIPKDGPSAGITLFIALASLLRNTCVRPDVAVTGEITLRGAVLPVGGIKEKVLAAHRAGIKVVILPERNQKDLVDVPEQAMNELEIKFVKRVDEVLPMVLGEVVPCLEEETSKDAVRPSPTF